METSKQPLKNWLAHKMEALYHLFLSEGTQKKSERIILVIAIASFLLHLTLIILVQSDLIALNKTSNLLSSPIAAIYTPFSFILVYEVYLLIYYLPRSFTTYINKQYEIIVLIIIRRLFKDFGNLAISSDWFVLKYDLQFTYDLVTALLLFFLIFLFFQQSRKRYRTEPNEINADGTTKYIKIKKLLATALVPILVILAAYSFFNWFMDILTSPEDSIESFANINNIFFEQFFTVLIMVDVVMLLVSFFYTDQFHKVIRNSGFVISTILIRLSFNVEGFMNNALIIAGITFGLLMLIIHNKFEKYLESERVVKNL